MPRANGANSCGGDRLRPAPIRTKARFHESRRKAQATSWVALSSRSAASSSAVITERAFNSGHTVSHRRSSDKRRWTQSAWLRMKNRLASSLVSSRCCRRASCIGGRASTYSVIRFGQFSGQFLRNRHLPSSNAIVRSTHRRSSLRMRMRALRIVFLGRPNSSATAAAVVWP